MTEFESLSKVNTAFIFPSAYALGKINAVLTFDNDSNSVIISGTAQAVKKNTSFTLVVNDPDSGVAFTDQTVGVMNDKGVTEFVFEKFPFDINSKSGNYSFTVSGYNLGTADVLNHTNTDGDTLLSLLQAIEANSEHTAFMETNADALSINGTYAGGLDTNGIRIFNLLMGAVDYDLPAACETEAQYLQVIKCAKQFRNDYFEIASIASFNDITLPAQLTNWISTYDSIYNLSVDDISTTTVNEANLYSYVEKSKNKSQMTQNLILTDLISKSLVKSRIYEKALLCTIETEHYSESSIFLNNYQSLFQYNKAQFDSLYNEEKLSLYDSFDGTAYLNYAQAASKVDELALQLINARGSGGGNGGGGGGSGGGVGGGLMPSVPEIVTKKSFNDLSSVEWARDAIEYLCENEVISGKSEGVFAPNDNITRAEFIKIITLALDIPMSSGDYFADVSQNSWYAPFVYAAYDAGIVSGDEMNRFNPDRKITRQDMAVILYRAYGIDSSFDELGFSDSENISNYAKVPVAYFAKIGIINGMDNNNFAPFGNATRAQAAVMVYRSISHFEG